MKKILLSAVAASSLLALGTIPSSADCLGKFCYGVGPVVFNTPYYRWSQYSVRTPSGSWFDPQHVLVHRGVNVGPIRRAVYPSVESEAVYLSLMPGPGIVSTRVDE